MFALSSDLRRILTASAIALLGIFVVTIVALALPLQLLQPAWIQRTCSAILGGVSFPLVAVVLLVLAAEPAPGEGGRPAKIEEPPYITSCRRLAFAAAIGFALMIPLQTWAGVKVLQQVMTNDKEQLKAYTRALDLIRIAETPDALIFALQSIPGVPPSLDGQLKDPLPKVRQQLITQIEPQIKARQTQLAQINGERWQQGILRWVKEGLIAAFSALGFAAVGRLSPTKPTLLNGIQKRRASAKLYAEAAKAQKAQKAPKAR